MSRLALGPPSACTGTGMLSAGVTLQGVLLTWPWKPWSEEGLYAPTVLSPEFYPNAETSSPHPSMRRQAQGHLHPRARLHTRAYVLSTGRWRHEAFEDSRFFRSGRYGARGPSKARLEGALRGSIVLLTLNTQHSWPHDKGSASQVRSNHCA